MKKFIKRLLLFILPLAIIAISGEILLRRMPNDYTYKKTYLDSHSHEIKALVLGSSHSFYGINPEFLHTKSFNASHIAQSLDYDLAILKKYENHWDSLQYIILPIDYFSLPYKLLTGREAYRIKDYALYYDIKDNATFINTKEIFSNNLQINFSRFSNYYLKHKPNHTSSPLGWKITTPSDPQQNLIKTGKTAARLHLAKDDETVQENIAILNEIIEFSIAKHCKIILLTIPVHTTYLQHLDTNQLNTTIKTATQLTQKYPNVSYYNFLKDPAFETQDFYDADHLNEKGAKKFSIKVDSLITLNK